VSPTPVPEWNTPAWEQALEKVRGVATAAHAQYLAAPDPLDDLSCGEGVEFRQKMRCVGRVLATSHQPLRTLLRYGVSPADVARFTGQYPDEAHVFADFS
jgi:hypothetical protein